MKAQSLYLSCTKRICTIWIKASMGTRIFNPYNCCMTELIMCLPLMTGDCQEQTRQFHGFLFQSLTSLFLWILPKCVWLHFILGWFLASPQWISTANCSCFFKCLKNTCKKTVICPPLGGIHFIEKTSTVL